ncbi:MAG: mechanosensitive ion channel family protein [Thiobacillaceae bacterium]|nr:mechanosensitive ion channel family protein [Thiobacillaceae bacterium]MCX7673225.1 mechanosensitive ion channel family protein [Thiobacillaceae bacterium]MDW8323971.1 mechanosensitive ion channel family protein [Burkholderiales bacterium]
MKTLLERIGLDVHHELIPYVEKGLLILLVLVLAWVVLRLIRRMIAAFKRFALKRADDPEAVRRVETLARVIHYVATVLLVVAVVMEVLYLLGVSIAPLLGAAGVVGIAVGFGAQTLVKDYFNGFFLLLENQIRVGDFVAIAGESGFVEELTLRHVRLRAMDGNVHFIPTGMIDKVTNMSLEFSRAVIDVGVAYREDLDEVYAVMREVAAGMRADPAWGSRILEDLEILGVQEWASSAVMVRARFKVVPLQQWDVRREYLKRLKQAFDARGIEIPYPHLTLYAGRAKDGSAPPLRLVVEGDQNNRLSRS